MIYETFSEEETKKIAIELGKKATPGTIFCLDGDLGVGKTVFTKGIAEALVVDEMITSPTFTIVNEYMGKYPMYHFDTYRISDIGEMEEIGYEEYFFGQGVCIIEWAKIIESLIPDNAIHIEIKKELTKGENYRKIIVSEGIM